jgi:Fe-S-cluster containining protein
LDSLIQHGIRFQCQGSGRCCTSRGKYGYVYFTLEDRRRIAAHLGLATSAFTRRYCETTDGHVHLKHPERDCCFLEDKACSVYEARPTQCRTWPFWPENMKPRVWSDEIASFCPGVGKGRKYSRTEILEILESQADVPGTK